MLRTAIVWFVLATFVHAAPITYDIDLPGPDHTIYGTITTDGTLGNLATADVLSWSWHVDNTEFGGDSTSDAFTRSNGLFATDQQLLILSGGEILLDTESAEGPSTVGLSIDLSNPSRGAWVYAQWLASPDQWFVNEIPFVLASTAPEPSSIVLLAVGVAAVAVFRRK